MSDIVTLNGYKIKDEKAVRSYETVALMKADTKLKEGYHVKTKGYYEANDGGHGEYVIVNDNTLVDDGGTIHVLSNGLRAVLIIENDTINVKQFGAYGDGTHDDSNAIQNAVNLGNVILSKGNYYISSTINIPTNRIFDGGDCTIIPNSNIYAFTINGRENPVVNTVVKNININTQNSGSGGINLLSTYFNYFENVNIIQLTGDNAVGINIVNGFNHEIRNSRVYGNSNYSNQIGLKITTDNNYIFSNMTNCKYDTLLLQNLTYGVYANYSIAGNTIDFNNIGFSNNDYSFYLTGNGSPVRITNSRMEGGTKNANSTLVGFSLNGSILATIDSFNAYNITNVIDNNSSQDITLLGSISLTGTNQSPKYKIINHNTSNIVNYANVRLLTSVYENNTSNFTTGIINNHYTNKVPIDQTTGNINASAFSINTYKMVSNNVGNIYGIKGTECYVYTELSDKHFNGTTDGSQTALFTTSVNMTPYHLYHVIFLDNNKYTIVW